MKPKQKIVLVEDDLDIKEMYKMKLELSGYHVLTEEDGQRALGLIKKEKPNLVLLDILLPHKDGFEILKEIKNSQDSKINSIPVIVISNLSTEDDIAEAKKIGAFDFLVKAKTDPKEMIDRVNNFFERKG